MMRILLAEDDRALNQTLAYQLEHEGFIVDSCYDGEEALFYCEQAIHDIILLDRMLPCLEGTDILKQLRKKGIVTPIILITALGTLTDKVEGLNLGADDYLVKPFAFKEAALLEAFLRSGGQTLHRSTLLLKVWGPDSDVEDGNLDNYIHFLRRRLQISGSRLRITTVRGIGYRLQED